MNDLESNSQAVAVVEPMQMADVIRRKIVTFEEAMANFPGARFGNQEDCPLKHTFAGPIYVREIFIPKGTLLTGKIHRHEHPIFLLSGDVSIITEDTGMKRLKGPVHFISPKGIKRLLYTHEDTIFVTVHHVGEERDIGKIEDMLTAWTYEDYEKGIECSETPALSNG